MQQREAEVTKRGQIEKRSYCKKGGVERVHILLWLLSEALHTLTELMAR